MYIHPIGMSRSKQHFLPQLPCICATLRRSSRALTQRYELALRPLGLRSSQFTILQVLSYTGESSQRQIGEMLAMDSTSLTRTLGIMRRQGWITERRGDDRRERWLRLTKAGDEQLRRALPVWNNVQTRLRHQLGAKAWNDLFGLTNRLTAMVANQGGSL
jgi:DNA-binding MarR family transcriptional regulator